MVGNPDSGRFRRDQDQEKAQALDLGADDYLTKPFSTTELMARIRVAIRHAFRQNTAAVQKVLTVRELSLDLEKRQVTLRGQPLHLTPMEYNLLSLFLRNSGKVLTTAICSARSGAADMVRIRRHCGP